MNPPETVAIGGALCDEHRSELVAPCEAKKALRPFFSRRLWLSARFNS